MYMMCMYIYTIYNGIYLMECYSTIKKNAILSFAGKWMELETITLSDISQAQKDKSQVFSFICGRYIQVLIRTLSCMHIHTEHVSSSGAVRGD
jgi:hypothetical protein